MARSAEAAAYRPLYKTAAWQRLRERKLSSDPLCERCLLQEVVEPATVVHHVVAHKGDRALFYDYRNLESLCKPHHDRDGRLEDDGKVVVRFGPDGWPL